MPGGPGFGTEPCGAIRGRRVSAGTGTSAERPLAPRNAQKWRLADLRAAAPRAPLQLGPAQAVSSSRSERCLCGLIAAPAHSCQGAGAGAGLPGQHGRMQLVSASARTCGQHCVQTHATPHGQSVVCTYRLHCCSHESRSDAQPASLQALQPLAGGLDAHLVPDGHQALPARCQLPACTATTRLGPALLLRASQSRTRALCLAVRAARTKEDASLPRGQPREVQVGALAERLHTRPSTSATPGQTAGYNSAQPWQSAGDAPPAAHLQRLGRLPGLGGHRGYLVHLWHLQRACASASTAAAPAAPGCTARKGRMAAPCGPQRRGME